MFEELETLLGGLVRREFAFRAGQTLFRQGDKVQRVYFITAGMVHLTRHLTSGAHLVLQRAGAGTMLAEASLYSAQYHCDAIAVTEAKMWAVSKSELLRRLDQNPELGTVLAKRLANELQRARFHAEVLSIRTVAARLDAWVDWNGEMPRKGEWAGLAAELGVSPEALYREMANRRGNVRPRQQKARLPSGHRGRPKQPQIPSTVAPVLASKFRRSGNS